MIVAVAVCGFRLFPNTDVTVLSNGQTYLVTATFDPRAEGLEAANVALQPGDVVRYAGGDKFASVAIDHAQPVRIEADGLIIELRTHASTIEGALADAGVSLQAEDRVYLDDHLATARGPLAASVAASSRAIVPSGADDSRGVSADARPIGLSIVRARPVTFVVDSLPTSVRSSAPTVQAFLSDMGMTVREGDLVQPPLNTELAAGMTIRLANAKTVTVAIDGKIQTLYTQARTVTDVFALLGVAIGPEDILSLAPDALVHNGMSVSLGRTIVSDEDVLEPIEPGYRYEQDPSLAAGQTRTVAGVPGQLKTKYRITYKGGTEQSRAALGDGEVVLAPVPTRIIQGTKGNLSNQPPTAVYVPPAATPAPAPVYTPPVADAASSGGRQVQVWATWYNESHGGKDPGDYGYGITKSGRVLEKGICATDPNYIPLGTTFYVPGYGNCIAGDIGGGVRGWHIDLGFPEAGGIPSWGEQTVTITIFD